MRSPLNKPNKQDGIRITHVAHHYACFHKHARTYDVREDQRCRRYKGERSDKLFVIGQKCCQLGSEESLYCLVCKRTR